jgi:hypothetical protein
MSTKFEALVQEASEAGMAAGNGSKPETMYVVGGEKVYAVSEGPCGFAWITIKPANSSFARYLKASGLASSAYGGGVMVWVGLFGQSMMRKEAYAGAYAEVLRAAGIRAYAGSRMD